jgi:dephospho-CoA kinase
MRGDLRVALTGGIASGKTTVANLFAALGASVVDTDELAREVVAPGTDLLKEITEHFGPEFLTAEGGLERRKLRERIFSEPAERRWLEERTHPAIRLLTDARCDSATGAYCLVAIPLLVETGGEKRFDRVLVVDCEPEMQVARLMARDGITRAAALRMLSAQVSREARLSVADDVVRNDGDIAYLRDQVQRLHREYVAMAESKRNQQGTPHEPGRQ